MRDKLSLPEALLRLALNDMDQYTLNSKDDEFVQLNYRAKGMDDNIVTSLESKDMGCVVKGMSCPILL